MPSKFYDERARRQANIRRLLGQGFKRKAIMAALGLSEAQYTRAIRLQARHDRSPEAVAIAELKAEGHSEEVIRAVFG